MLNLAVQKENTAPTLANGIIISRNENGYGVETDDGRFQARKATSCLMKPMPGDYALLTEDALGDWYILAILSRPEEEHASTDLEFSGRLNVNIKGAGLTVASEGEITMTSGVGLSLIQPHVNLEAESAEAAVGRLSFLGLSLKSKIGRIESVAERVEQVFGHLTQKLIDHFRHIAGHEEVRTHSTRYLVEDTLTMQARQAEHTAAETVRINADQIHMG
jgi:hypothetical protein